MRSKKEFEGNKGTKILYIHIPFELYDMYDKICKKKGISKKQGIVDYFKYLYWHEGSTILIDEESDYDFKLGE